MEHRVDKQEKWNGLVVTSAGAIRQRILDAAADCLLASAILLSAQSLDRGRSLSLHAARDEFNYTHSSPRKYRISRRPRCAPASVARTRSRGRLRSLWLGLA